MEDDRYARMTLRLPRSLYSHIEQAADDAGKSVTAEIVYRLEKSFSQEINDIQLASMFEALKHSYLDKERIQAQQTKAVRLIFNAVIKNFESAVDTLEGNRQLTKSDLRRLRLDLSNAIEAQRMLEHNKSGEHISIDDEDDHLGNDDNDFEQEEPGLPIRNKP